MSKWRLGVKVLTVEERRCKYRMAEGKEEPCGVKLKIGIEDISTGPLLFF